MPPTFYRLLVYYVCFTTCTAIGANILGLMPVPVRSHHIWNSALLHRLAELGHNVTILSVDIPRPSDKVPSNVHYIHLEKGYSASDDCNFDVSSLIRTSAFISNKLFYDLCYKSTINTANSSGLQVLLDYPDDFKVDLILYDYDYGPMLLGFVHKFGYPPTIGLNPFLNPPNKYDAMLNHFFPAYVPFPSTHYGLEMNFWQRMHNAFLFITDAVYRQMIFLPKVNAVMRPYYPKDMPLLEEVGKHTTLVMVNTHPVISGVEPVPMNVIEVGGMHVRDVKPLPREFEEFVNGSRNGVVLIAFGMNMRSMYFKQQQVHVLVDAMTQLKEYDFIWKFDVKYLKQKSLPENIFVRSFLPQGDLLAHPKVKAFVTHCGAQSTYESIWHGVPMVGIPLHYDHYRISQRTVSLGIATSFDYSTMTAEQLREGIKRVMKDSKMAAKAKLIASQFQDQPMKPIDRAVWWSEYLLRNPSPSFLKSPAEKLSTIQANCWDVFFVWFTILALLTFFTVKLVSMVVKSIPAAVHRLIGNLFPATKTKTI